MNNLYLVSIFSLALLISYCVVPFISRWAIQIGAVDKPDTRKTHHRIMPRIGGVAIFIAWLFPVLFFNDINREALGIIVGAITIFLTGFIDDTYSLLPRYKIVGQIAACVATMVIGNIYIVSLGELPGIGIIMLPNILIVPFTLFAIVGIVNAVNMIDGLDGLASGVAIIALLGLSILAYLSENYIVLPITTALIGGIVGFLRYNYYPARIFMGDSGSLLIGFIIAFVAAILTQPPSTGVRPVLPVLLLGIPIVDTIWVSGTRILKGCSPFSADRTHIHHRFLEMGFQHKTTVIIIYCISLFLTALTIIYHHFKEPLVFLLYASSLISLYLLIVNIKPIKQS